MGKKTFAFPIVLVTLLSLPATAAFAADMLSGKWKVNKSTTNTQEIISVANGVSVVGDSVNATGIKEHREFTVQFDSKDYPFKQTLDGKPITDGNDMVSAKKIDDYTFELTRKRQGAVLAVIKMIVSRDGKTLTSTVNGTDQGQAFTASTIYEKQ